MSVPPDVLLFTVAETQRGRSEPVIVPVVPLNDSPFAVAVIPALPDPPLPTDSDTELSTVYVFPLVDAS